MAGWILKYGVKEIGPHVGVGGGWRGRSAMPASARSGRRLTVEPLEMRSMLAADMGLVSGTVFADRTGDRQTADDLLLAGVTIRLARDGGDGVFGGDDSLVGTRATDAMGNYRFDRLSAGRYFVEEVVPQGMVTRMGANVATVDISETAAAGRSGRTIDSFDSPQMVSASSGGASTGATALVDAEVLGGERDLFIQLLSGMGVVSLESNFVGMGVLQFSSNGNAMGEAEVVWDGPDEDARVVDPTGLGGVDLTQFDGNAMAALLLQAGAEQAGAELTVEVFSDAENSSRATLTIPDTGGIADESFCIHFADFEAASGNGANFASVGAIRLAIASGATAVDTQVALTGTVGPTVFDADFANLEALSIGDLVFSDANNNGLFDVGVESGIQGVTLNLFADTDGSGELNPEADMLVATTTSGAAGGYLFADVFAGTYFVQIPPSQFEPDGPLAGMISSTGNDPAPDPDDNTDQDDNGTPLAGLGVASGSLTVIAGEEPTNDGDENANTNRTVDFGFFAEIDLEVTKTASATPATAGSELTYAIVVTNNGAAAASGVVLMDMLPPEVTFVSATATQGPVPTQMEGVVTADLGAIPGGQSATVTVVVAVPSGFSGTLTNTAAATSAENDVDPQNNSIMLVTPVALQADLAVMKTGDVEPIVPGQTLTYSVQVTNSGPSDATGVTLTDMLPAGVTFVSATSSQGDPPTQSAGVVTANLGGLAAGATATVTIQVTVNSSTTGTLENTATVTSPTPDANVENNSAVESTEVTPEVNLEVVKADSLDPVTSGQMLTYTLTVTNNGPADATGVILTDTLPTGVSFASATASQGDPPMALEGVVTVALGNLAAGGSATVTIVVDVGRNTFGPITNTASVTASEPETDPADNMASQTTEVELAPASLSGFVFVDFDNNGLFDGRDVPIPGVTILLTGTDLTGAMVSRTTRTIEDGSYLFEDLLPGIYRIEEVQPGFFPDGQETVGTAGGVAQDNVFEMIDLMGGIDGEGYNFAELVPRLTKRDFLASSARPG